MSVRLIATDLDGTLLRPDLRLSPRTLRALAAARAAGIPVVPVTARQPRGLRPIARAAGFGGWTLCGNGALCVHLGTGEVLFEAHVAADVQRAVAEALSARARHPVRERAPGRRGLRGAGGLRAPRAVQ